MFGQSPAPPRFGLDPGKRAERFGGQRQSHQQQIDDAPVAVDQGLDQPAIAADRRAPESLRLAERDHEHVDAVGRHAQMFETAAPVLAEHAGAVGVVQPQADVAGSARRAPSLSEARLRRSVRPRSPR